MGLGQRHLQLGVAEVDLRPESPADSIDRGNFGLADHDIELAGTENLSLT